MQCATDALSDKSIGVTMEGNSQIMTSNLHLVSRVISVIKPKKGEGVNFLNCSLLAAVNASRSLCIFTFLRQNYSIFKTIFDIAIPLSKFPNQT